ncbi:hypothetical protein Taro_020291 [Colocasia esculenta]|uniref:Uncharacterized protein n=1 Tax=Colocasia esculenta TaxID=4460 RepID=A0A843UYF7_COLES|nr:hypothetical protein [Colocasia esculenta]
MTLKQANTSPIHLYPTLDLAEAWRTKGRRLGTRRAKRRGLEQGDFVFSTLLQTLGSLQREKVGEVQWLWTFRVAVVLGGRGVDANLRILQLPTGTEGWLDDRRMGGVAELREESSWRGAILVGARGGFGVNQEIAGGSSVF